VLVVENVKPFDLPEAPTGTAAVPVAASSGAIRVTWVDGSDNETGFVVERARKKNGVFSVVGTVGANVLTYEDRGLPARTLFYYRVRAVNGARTSAASARTAAAAD
jgi:titin